MAGLLVPLEACWAHGVKFPVSVGVQVVCFGVVFEMCNSFQRLRNEKRCQKNHHREINNILTAS